MKSLLIGYDLNKSGQDYKKLREKIESMFSTWWSHLNSTYIVNTDLSAKEVRDTLIYYIDSNDELLVCTLTGEAAWIGFKEKGSNWLKNNLKEGCPAY